jgi:hypothetical protein
MAGKPDHQSGGDRWTVVHLSGRTSVLSVFGTALKATNNVIPAWIWDKQWPILMLMI